MLYQLTMEEKNREQHQFITTLSKSINQKTIDAALNEVIDLNNYSRKMVCFRCLDSQFIIKIIYYIFIRQGINETEIIRLQLEIKQRFAFLPGLPKINQQVKSLEQNFLFQIFVLSQIVNSIIRKLGLTKIGQVDAESIFITIIFLSTDKLVTPYCYHLIHKKLQKTVLPFGRQLQTRKLSVNLRDTEATCETTEADNFKQEVRNIIRPKSREKQPMKIMQPVCLMLNKFKHKENMSHYTLNKEIKEGYISQKVDICRSRKCYSLQSDTFTKISYQRSNKHKKEYTWSKCELVKTHYIPFCRVKAPVVQKNKHMVSNSFKFKILKQKTVHFQEKQTQMLLKI